MRRTSLAPLYLLAVLTAGCNREVPFMRSQTPHEAYADSLKQAGLHETALGRDWIAAAESAVRNAKAATLPLDLAAEFPASQAKAAGYRLALKRGRVLRVEVALKGPEPAIVFLDLFAAPASPAESPRRVASADRGATRMEREIDRDGDYILRIQPELLRGGTLQIVQRTTAALNFPVAGRTSAAVQSYFMDPRDGGKRDHHGVDIFAPHGTPVVAASSGYVSSVATTPLGGHVVWVWDPRRGQSHYYAHLSRQAVSIGTRVEAGEVIGYVGNTGNARRTPPHLHFGIYARGDGPIDPLPFVQGAKGVIAAAN